MSSLTLDTLPAEVLHNICDFVLEDHKPSLSDISLVSKACCTAASASLFRDLTLEVSGPKRLVRDAQKLHSLLGARDALRHVRSITLEGYLDMFSDEEEGEGENGPGGRLPFVLTDDNYYGEDEIFGARQHNGVFVADGNPTASDEEDNAWSGIAELLRATPALRDLFHDCDNVFAPVLLNVLHESLPHCRLHLLQFRFRRLKNDMRLPHELKLITSPCLQSISVRYVYRDSNGNDDFNFAATRRMIAGLAPNLKHAKMLRNRPASSPQLMRRRGQPVAKWQGFDDSIGPFKPGVLKSINLLESESLEQWSSYVDFSEMENVYLNGDMTIFNWFAQACNSEALTALTLDVGVYGSQVAMSSKSTAVAGLLKSRRGLKSLKLTGDLDNVMLDAALDHHGSTLENLKVIPRIHWEDEDYRPVTLDASFVRKLIKSCPMVNRLHLMIDRTSSDAVEVEMYRLFGSLPCLKSLFLHLNCKFDEEEGTKGLLMNAAFDDTLARAIWDVMFAAQPKNGRLQSVRLVPETSGLGSAIDYDLGNRLRELTRAFQVTRSVRDDSDEADIRELGQKARLARLRQSYIPKARGNSRVDEIWHSIWPAKEGSDSWLDDWKSIPLDLTIA